MDPATHTPSTAEEWNTVLAALLRPESAESASQCADRGLSDWRCVPLLMQTFSQTPDLGVLQMCPVLLRLRIQRHWDDLPKEVQTSMQEALCSAITKDPPLPNPVVFSVADLIARIAEMTVPSGEWSEMLGWLGHTYQQRAGDTLVRRSLLRILNALSETDVLGHHYMTLHEIYLEALQAPDTKLAVEAVKGLPSLSCAVETEEAAELFSHLIEPLMKIVMAAMQQGVEEVVYDGMKALEEIISHELNLLGDHLPELIRFSLTVANTKTNPKGLRQKVLRIVEAASHHKPTLLLRSNLLGGVLVVLFGMGVEEDQEEEEEYDDDEENLPNFNFTVQMIDILATTLPTKFIFQPIMAFIDKLKESENPLDRRCGLSVLATIAEGCYKELTPIIESHLLPLIQVNLQHPDLKVRTAACFCVTEYSKHLHPNFQEHHAIIIELMVGRLSSNNPRERGRALFSLENFFLHMEPEDLSGYFPSLIPGLVELLGKSDVEEKGNVLTCVASLILTGGELLSPHYDNFMAVFFPLLNQDQHLFLRARAMECIGILGAAVGKEQFSKNFMETVQLSLAGLEIADREEAKSLLKPKLAKRGSEASELKELTWTFFHNIAKIMKEEMAGCLPQIMPLLLQTATSKTGISVKSEAGIPQGIAPDQSSWTGVMVRETFLEEKVAAVDTIGGLASCIGPQFLPYVTPSLQILAPLAGNFYPKMKKSVLGCLKELCFVVFFENLPPVPEDALPGRTWAPGKMGAPFNQTLIDLLDTVLSLLINPLTLENSPEVVTGALESIRDLLKIIGPRLLKDQGVFQALFESLMILLERDAVCQSKCKDLGADDDRLENVRVFEVAIEITTEMGLAVGERSLPFLQAAVPLIFQYAQPTMTEEYRLIAIGCLGELSRDLPQCVTPNEELLTLVLHAVTHQGSSDVAVEVRRNGLYALGIFCQQFPAVFQPAFPQIVEILSRGVDEKGGVSDNAAGTLARLIILSPSCAGAPWIDPAIELLFKCLPLEEDGEPYKVVLTAMFPLLEKDGIEKYLPLFVQTFCDALLQHRNVNEGCSPVEPPIWSLPPALIQQTVNCLRMIAQKSSQSIHLAMADASEELQKICQEALGQ